MPPDRAVWPCPNPRSPTRTCRRHAGRSQPPRGTPRPPSQRTLPITCSSAPSRAATAPANAGVWLRLTRIRGPAARDLPAFAGAENAPRGGHHHCRGDRPAGQREGDVHTPVVASLSVFPGSVERVHDPDPGGVAATRAELRLLGPYGVVRTARGQFTQEILVGHPVGQSAEFLRCSRPAPFPQRQQQSTRGRGDLEGIPVIVHRGLRVGRAISVPPARAAAAFRPIKRHCRNARTVRLERSMGAVHAGSVNRIGGSSPGPNGRCAEVADMGKQAGPSDAAPLLARLPLASVSRASLVP